MKNQNIKRKIIVLLALAVYSSPKVVQAATTLYLHNTSTSQNAPFLVTNMFPGDAEQRSFQVSVSYRNEVTVKCSGNVRSGGEKLAEVLWCRVDLLNTGEKMYQGLLRDMPDCLEHTLVSGAETVEELSYSITLSLDTGVGNEYQNKELTVDFQWWVEETGNLGSSPKTGDGFRTGLWLGLLGVSGLGMCLLLLVCRKEERDES